MDSSQVMAYTSMFHLNLPRHQSSSPSLQLLHDKSTLPYMSMDDFLKNIYSDSDHVPVESAAKNSVDEVRKEIVNQSVAGTSAQPPMTLEDFLIKAGVVREEIGGDGGGFSNKTVDEVWNQLFASTSVFGGDGGGVLVAENQVFGNGGVARGKRRAVEEAPVEKATQQRQRRMIKNRARSRERKQVYTVELESLVTLTHLEEENARLMQEEAYTSKGERKSEGEISIENLREHFGRPLDEAAMSFGVSRSTFKRICRDLGIKRWQHRKRRMDGDISSNLTRRLKDGDSSKRNISYPGITHVQNTAVACAGEDLNKMIVKVTYNNINIRFTLPGLSGIAELENNVIERLHLERKSFSIKYQDDEGDWVLIACDKDVQECMEISRSMKKTTIKLLLDHPITYKL